VQGESADILREAGAGEVFEPENADALVAGLLRLKGDAALLQCYRTQGLAAARHFDRAELAQRMLRLLEQVAQRR
jgi:glycosyltransferase involved in cell wall biosynthesis